MGKPEEDQKRSLKEFYTFVNSHFPGENTACHATGEH